EIAGINDRYHPSKASQLKALIESEKHDEALEEAAAYIEEYTKDVLKFFPAGIDRSSCAPLEFILRDTCFNRGLKGAATVLQIALDVPVDGVVGEQTRAAFAKAINTEEISSVAKRLTEARAKLRRYDYVWRLRAIRLLLRPVGFHQ